MQIDRQVMAVVVMVFKVLSMELQLLVLVAVVVLLPTVLMELRELAAQAVVVLVVHQAVQTEQAEQQIQAVAVAVGLVVEAHQVLAGQVLLLFAILVHKKELVEQ
jgi:hypothetical protein